MSVITTVEAVPSRLRAFYAFFRGRPKGEDAARVEHMLSPAPLRQPGKNEEAEGDEAGRANVYRNSLREALNLKLLEEEGDRLRPTGIVSGEATSLDEQFLRWVEPRLLDPAQAAVYEQRSVAYALAWLLMQSPLLPIPFAQNVATRIKREFSEEADAFDLTSKERFQNLAYWAKYLGYATLLQDRCVVADPTLAMKRLLPGVFTHHTELRVDDFFRALAALVPVFEEGVIREELEGRSESQRGRAASQRLSGSTSLALRRLSDAKIVELRELSDAGVRILDLGDVQQRVSHIALLKQAA